MSIPGSNKDRFHFLDGLRAIASLLIVVHHSLTAGAAKFLYSIKLYYLASVIAYLSGSGVVLFFVLSGIVLLRPYLRGERKFKVLDYFMRRLKRIYPPFFAALIFGYLVLTLIKAGPQTYYSAIWRWTDLSFPEFIRQAFIINFKGIYFNLAWWSLQVEVVFYILVPFFVFFFTFKKQLRYIQIFITLVLIMAASFTLQVFLTNHYPSIYSSVKLSLTVFRFIDYPISFALGVYLAKFDFEKYIGRLFVLVGLLMILVPGIYGPLINAGYSFLYAGIIVIAFKSKKLQYLLDRPIMIWLGERSYSLFLVHFSFFYLSDYICSLFITERNAYYGLFSRMIGIPLAFVGAIVLFHLVERRQARGLITDKIFWPWQIGRLNAADTKETHSTK